MEGQDNKKGIRKCSFRYIPKECNDILIGYLRGNVYVGVTTGSAAALTYGLVSDKFKRKDDDKKKIQVFLK